MKTTDRIDGNPQEAERTSERSSRKELLEAIRSQPEVVLDRPVADVLREERDRR